MTSEKLFEIRKQITEVEALSGKIKNLNDTLTRLKGNKSSIRDIEFEYHSNPSFPAYDEIKVSVINMRSLGFKTQAEFDNWFKDMIIDRLQVLVNALQKEYDEYEIK